MNISRKKVAFHTLGCKLNFTETSAISRLFPEERFEKVPASGKADIYVINTCSVTDAADKKCKQAIRKFIHQSPDAFIAVVGCYAQLRPQEISSIPGVDLVLGTNEKFDIIKYIENNKKKKKPEIYSCELSESDSFSDAYSIGDRTRSFLKVQDGCDYGCSYCTVPLARGRSRNPDIETLLREAKDIADRGVREVVLTGVNVGDFGKSTGDSLAGLMKELLKIQGIGRFRISSIEPNLLTDEIIEMSALDPRLLPHFHIPLQSGNNRVLALMGRRYRRELFAERVMKVKSIIPLAGLGADVIAGFPGETDADFDDTYDFLKSQPLTYLHVFTYSERPGTRAAAMPGKINHAEKERRSKLLISLSHEKHDDFLALNTGQPAEVLFEKTKVNGMIAGYTGNYIRIAHPWESGLAGSIRKVILKNMAGDGRMNVEII